MTRIPAGSRDDSEIRQVEDDLRNLHRRYAHLERSARRLRISFYFLVVALAALIVGGAVMGNMAALVSSVALLIIVILIAWASAHAHPELRWIDYAGWWPEGIYPWTVKRSEAQAVEDMAAERMERLAQLKRNYQ
jgi:hypothetical protein